MGDPREAAKAVDEAVQKDERTSTTAVPGSPPSWRRVSARAIGSGVGVLAVRREVGPLLVLILLAVYFQSVTGHFLEPEQILSLGSLGSSIAIVSVGVTLLIVSGEFDLSVGSTYAFAPIAMALFLIDWQLPDWLALLAALALTAVLGVVNGVITTYFGIPSLITTLAASFGINGLNIYVTDGNNLLYFHPSAVLSALGGAVGGTAIQAPVVWAIAVTAVLWFVLEWTPYGNWAAAAGGRGGVGREMGVAVRRVKITNFALCSLTAGFAGCISFAAYGAVNSGYGQNYQLLAIVATVVGGTSIFGVTGSIIGAFIGSLTLATLSTGIILAGAPGSWYQSIIGVVLVVAVIANVRIASFGERLLRLSPGRRTPK